MKYYIISGENSGDLYGGHLMKSLAKYHNKNVNFICWGGDNMRQNNGEIVRSLDKLSFMGFWEVLKNFRTVIYNFQLIKRELKNKKPEILILIDYPGFNLKVAQYAKSNELFAMKTGYNERVAQKAEADEFRKLDEIHTEAAFDTQEQRIKHLQEEGKIRALGQAGVSVGKTHQAAAANFGYTVAALNEGLESAGLATLSALEDIKNDKFSANLAAYAEKMSDPGELPMPIQPIPSPRTIYDDPAPLMDFHFGPPPVKGAMVSASAASNAAWGAAIPSIVSGGLQAYNLFN